VRLHNKAIMSAAVLSLAMASLFFSSNSFAGNWCHRHRCRTNRVVHYRGCRKFIKVRRCYNRHGFRYCRVVRRVRWVC